jgi:hypothetical protein
MLGSVYVPIKPVIRIWSPVSSRTSLLAQSVNDSPKSNEQDLCAWRRFLSIDNARLDHIKVTLPEYVLLAGGLGQPMRPAQDYFSLASM